jgi:molybdopterin converting factor small subunit
MKLYFSANCKSLGAESDKVLAASTFLEGPAFDWFEPKVRAWFDEREQDRDDEINELFADYSKFERLIRLTFGEIDEKSSAAQKLHRLKQTGSAARYASEFQQISSHLEWDDEALADKYYQGLKDDVKDDIARIAKRPDTLSGMIEVAVKIDNRIYERKMEKRGSYAKPFGGYGGKKKSWNKRRDPDAMDIDNVNLKPKQDWKKKSQKKGKCFNCGKEGHFARECFKGKQDNKRIEVRTTRFRQVDEVPETPPQAASDELEMVEEVPKTPPQSTQNEPEITERLSTPFYTPAEPESHGMTPEQAEMFDQWIDEELATVKEQVTEEHQRLPWWLCSETLGQTNMCPKHHIEHEQATEDECWTYHWQSATDWECEAHPIPSTVKYEGKEYLICQKPDGRLATPIFCDEPDIATEIRLTQTNPGDWTPVWEPVRVDIYTPGMKPLALDAVDKILDDMTNSDLIQDEDWERIEHEDSQDNALVEHPQHKQILWIFCRDDECPFHREKKERAGFFPRTLRCETTGTQRDKNHARMEIRTTNLGRGRGGDRPPAYTSRIDVSRTRGLDEPLTPEWTPTPTGMTTLSEDVARNLIQENEKLQETMERLSLEVEVMATVADDWQTRANTVEARLTKRVEELEKQLKRQRLEAAEKLVELEHWQKAVNEFQQETDKAMGAFSRRHRDDLQELAYQVIAIKERTKQMAELQQEMEKAIQGILEMFKWELLSNPDEYERINEILTKRMRETKVNDVISLWRELVSGESTQESRTKAKTSDSGNDRAMRK